MWIFPFIGLACFVGIIHWLIQYFKSQGTMATSVAIHQSAGEDQVVEFSAKDTASGMQWAKLSLLGRLFMENPPILYVIGKIVNGAWEMLCNL
ncbi:unnamed protein product [Linum trigynum]|uniref:Uncharacterized protein n=1 Tax=Linum trigynum TaxID=586398 RepID=A0AAV2F747_9ROSI